MERIYKKPKIIMTSGEPAGIGPDIIIQLSQRQHNHDLTLLADPDLLKERAKRLSIPLEINIVQAGSTHSRIHKTGTLNVLPVSMHSHVKPGELNVANARYVLDMIRQACTGCLNSHFDALVTAPIQKSIINDAGISFRGHTDYLADLCNQAFPVMLLASHELKVALLTTHLPLRDVADSITAERLETVLTIIIKEMQEKFGVPEPIITVCGLNPHAGENGHLGMEEKEIIEPVINKLNAAGHPIKGPLSADTAFTLEKRQQTDVYVCMYHDQGLPVLKTLGFGEAVNITLGLPIIRTSVDHGTALELAGTGQAHCDSLIAAIEMAETISVNQTRLHKENTRSGTVG